MTRYAVVNACVDFRDIRQVFVVTNNMDVGADEEKANMKAARERAEQEQKEIDDRASASPVSYTHLIGFRYILFINSKTLGFGINTRRGKQSCFISCFCQNAF